MMRMILIWMSYLVILMRRMTSDDDMNVGFYFGDCCDQLVWILFWGNVGINCLGFSFWSLLESVIVVG